MFLSRGGRSVFLVVAASVLPVLMAYFATISEIPQARSGPVNGCSASVLVRARLFHSLQSPYALGPILFVSLCSVSFTGD
jgi:hypothetical protein